MPLTRCCRNTTPTQHCVHCRLVCPMCRKVCNSQKELQVRADVSRSGPLSLYWDLAAVLIMMQDAGCSSPNVVAVRCTAHPHPSIHPPTHPAPSLQECYAACTGASSGSMWSKAMVSLVSSLALHFTDVLCCSSFGVRSMKWFHCLVLLQPDCRPPTESSLEEQQLQPRG